MVALSFGFCFLHPRKVFVKEFVAIKVGRLKKDLCFIFMVFAAKWHYSKLTAGCSLTEEHKPRIMSHDHSMAWAATQKHSLQFLLYEVSSNKSHSTEMTETYFHAVQLHENSYWHRRVQKAGQALLSREGFKDDFSTNIPPSSTANTATQENNGSRTEGETSQPKCDAPQQAQSFTEGCRGGRAVCWAAARATSFLCAAFTSPSRCEPVGCLLLSGHSSEL